MAIWSFSKLPPGATNSGIPDAMRLPDRQFTNSFMPFIKKMG